MSALIWFSCVLLAIYIVFKICWALLRNRMVRTTTSLLDVDKLALHPRKPEQKIHGAAVIAGGSLAGFLTARILADYFEQVIIIELDSTLGAFSRVPQRLHLHYFSSLVLYVFRKLFPNFDQEARKEDGMVGNGWMRWTVGGFQASPKPENVLERLNISRAATETLTRRLVKEYAHDSVQIVQGAVVGVQPSSDGTRIKSVSFRPTTGDIDSPNAPVQTIPASLFADCTGTSSISSKILPAADVGWGPFPSHQYNPNVEYRTATVYVPEHVREALSRSVPVGDPDYGRWDRTMIFDAFHPTPDVINELYAIQKVDGNRLVLLHCGWGVERLAENYSQFVDAVRSIRSRTYRANPFGKKPSDWIFDFLGILGESVENIDDVKFAKFKMGPCRWIDFAAAPLPANFITIGDARMVLNPIFGQGVSKILSEVAVLNTVLSDLVPPSSTASIPSLFSRKYFHRAQQATASMNDMNRMLDYGYDTTTPLEGDALESGESFRKYFVGLMSTCEKDNRTATVMSRSLSGVAPGIDLMHPYIVLKVYLSQWLAPRR